MKRQKAFALLHLLIEVVITLFVAGIVVPSLIRSDLATNEAFAVGSLHTINIAGITLSYTNQNVEFAIWGGLVGATAAFAMAFPRPFQPVDPTVDPKCGSRRYWPQSFGAQRNL